MSEFGMPPHHLWHSLENWWYCRVWKYESAAGRLCGSPSRWWRPSAGRPTSKEFTSCHFCHFLAHSLLHSPYISHLLLDSYSLSLTFLSLPLSSPLSHSLLSPFLSFSLPYSLTRSRFNNSFVAPLVTFPVHSLFLFHSTLSYVLKYLLHHSINHSLFYLSIHSLGEAKV
jgi:hypothetical protein